MKKLKVILIGAGHRGTHYTNLMGDMPEKFEVVGIAEKVATRREYVKEKHNIPDENTYESWEQILEREKFADVAVIATMDRMHFEPAMKAMELGYDLLLEKPVCPTPEECVALYKKSKECGVKAVVCHVLRYTTFFKKMKECIDSGMVGDVVSVEHLEAVGNVHQSHSFVRGNWGNSTKSSFMMLQKSCHDLDILQWLLGKECKKISSFGSLKHFKRENAPEGSPEYCMDSCPVADTCYYNAMKLYYEDKDNAWFRSNVVKKVNPTDEEVLKGLRETQYGKCVYKCNNDVVDHQVVNMEFEDGITVSFTMCAFNKGGRRIHIMGTKGEITAAMKEDTFEFYDFASGETKRLNISQEILGDSIVSGHGGGDQGVINALYDYLTDKITADDVSEIGVSAKNHMLAFAAEEARLGCKVVDMEEFCQRYYK